MVSSIQDLNIVKKLGEGLTGEVHLIRDEGLIRALKILKNDPGMMAEAEVSRFAEAQKLDKAAARAQLKDKRRKLHLAGFRFEAEVLKRLSHRHVARFFDFGFAELEHKYFMISEFVEGVDLFKATEGLQVPAIEELLIGVLRGLHYLHNQGICHFDLKEGNILVQGAGEAGVDTVIEGGAGAAAGAAAASDTNDTIPGVSRHAAGIAKANVGNATPATMIPKIIDFGMANFDARPEYKEGKGGFGTPRYMAPEIWLGERPDFRADLYSMGVIIYRVLARQAPFVGKSPAEYKQLHYQQIPTPPSAINPAIPKYWDQIVLRLLAKNPSERHPNAGFLIREICLLSGRASYDVETGETAVSYLPEHGRLIGRDAELAQFARTLHRTLIARELNAPQLFVVRGSKGSGKTRFLEEAAFQAKLGHEVRVVGWEALATEATAIEKPTLLVLDSNATHDRGGIINFLQNHRDEPVLVVIAEPGDFAWAFCEEAQMRDLSPDEIREYLRLIVKSDGTIPDAVIAKLYRDTHGNPYLLTETLRSMIDAGLLVDQSGPWSASLLEDMAGNLADVKPVRVEDFASAEIERLHPTILQHRILETIAVLERPATLEELQGMCKNGEKPCDSTTERGPVNVSATSSATQPSDRPGGASESDTESALYPLVRGGILSERPEGFAFVQEAVAGHVMQILPAEKKSATHARIAKYLCAHGLDIVEILWHEGKLPELAARREMENDFNAAARCYERILREKGCHPERSPAGGQSKKSPSIRSRRDQRPTPVTDPDDPQNGWGKKWLRREPNTRTRVAGGRGSGWSRAVETITLGFECSEHPVTNLDIEAKLANALFQAGRFAEAKARAQKTIDDQVVAQPSSTDSKGECERGTKGGQGTSERGDTNPLNASSDALWTLNEVCLRVALRYRDLPTIRSCLKFVEENLWEFLQSESQRVKRIFFQNRCAQAFLMEGNTAKAEEIFLKSHRETMGLESEEAGQIYNNDLDDLYYQKNRFDEAEQVCREKLQASRTPVQKSRCHYQLGLILDHKNQGADAVIQWEECIRLSKSHRDIRRSYEAYNALCRYFALRDDLVKSSEYGERALQLAQKLSDIPLCATIASNLGRIFNARGEYQNAYHYLIYSLRNFEMLAEKSAAVIGQHAAAKLELAACCRSLNDQATALKLLEELKLQIDSTASLAYLKPWLEKGLAAMGP